MPDDISLLPEDQRRREEELKGETKPGSAPEELKFSIPPEEKEEIEVIEVDEGEVEQVLASEPGLARFAYKLTTFLEKAKNRLFQPHAAPPPPKLPPQFFAPPPAKPRPAAPVPAPSGVMPAPGAPVPPAFFPPPAPSAVPTAAVPGAPAVPIKPKAQIVPLSTAPRRVKVIRRVRKPIHVSLVSEEELKFLRIDIPKRRFTFITIAVLFAVLLGGGYYLLRLQLQTAEDGLRQAESQLADVQTQISQKQGTWASFQDLEPRLKALGQLLDRHVSPTRLLELIEQHTLPSVAYTVFSLTPDNKVNLGVTTDSFESAAGQIAAFQRSGFVSSVAASGYSAQYDPPSALLPSSVTFQLVLSLSNEALRAPVASAAP